MTVEKEQKAFKNSKDRQKMIHEILTNSDKGNAQGVLFKVREYPNKKNSYGAYAQANEVNKKTDIELLNVGSDKENDMDD